ncbi:hypothetical protein HMI54_012447 [Coelomomyces lativittatus]|nr:hypothetical protein HMI54_012447 [Coelomomyces lativittatus]
MSSSHQVQIFFEASSSVTSVIATGTFDAWNGLTKMLIHKRNEDKTTYLISIQVGMPLKREKLLFKFIVDGKWVCSPQFETEWDNCGNENNVLWYGTDVLSPHFSSSVEMQGEMENENVENVTRKLDPETEAAIKELESKKEKEMNNQFKMETEIQTIQEPLMEMNNMNLTPISCEKKEENLPMDSCAILEPPVEQTTSTISNLLPTKAIQKKGNKKQGCFMTSMFKFHFTKPKFLKRRN